MAVKWQGSDCLNGSILLESDVLLGITNPSAPSGTSFNIRTVTREGEPWFVVVDVCRVLGFDAGQSNNYTRHLDRDELMKVDRKTHNPIMGAPGGPGLTVASESGLYKLVMRSDKPAARAFQDWVTREVLPSIRKTGAYVVGQPSVKEVDDPLDLMMALAVRFAHCQNKGRSIPPRPPCGL